jgi:L-malate glycosyltransferase
MLLAAGTIHTIRLANGLASVGADVHLVTQHPLTDPVDERVSITSFSSLGVAGYFLMVSRVRRLLEELEPDVLNAHYASGYATTARLTGFHPWVLSVWGSDVYDFPGRSPVHRWLIRTNLMAADKVASTSRCMAERTLHLAPELRDIAVTPFGVDLLAFSKTEPLERRPPDGPIVIGTVKTLAYKYGVDTLLCAFAAVRRELASEAPSEMKRLRLRIVGTGPGMDHLKRLAKNLDLAEVTEFVGWVPHAQVPSELSKLDLYVALSRLDSESFGVAVIEAGAARRPVVVSDAGGLPEVVRDGETGLVVPRDDPAAAASAIKRLVLDRGLRERMGDAGHDHVAREYSWETSVSQMVRVLKGASRKRRESIL